MPGEQIPAATIPHMKGPDDSADELTIAIPALPLAGAGDAVDRLRVELDAMRAELAATQARLEHWRTRAMDGWEQAAKVGGHQFGGDEAAAMRQTLSWRITRPLRIVRRVLDARAAR